MSRPAPTMPLLGEPTGREPYETCWGTDDSLSWESGEEAIYILFRDDEFYQWISSDRRLAATYLHVSPGTSVAWLEQLIGEEFETYVSEIGGRTTVTNLPFVNATTDAAATVIQTVEYLWHAERERLFTVVHDPFENPDLWCGD
ncbi:MAG: hypothetical protein P8J50_16655 [Acidimicrobiales bacterium]|nr:hypothetical protein [Acidimicrobiales bacterium]